MAPRLRTNLDTTFGPLTSDRRQSKISIKMWIVSGVLIVVATILGVIGIRVKTTRL
jgi:heme/copper-type cytochrome/quinol oxidase subunit 1